MSRTPTRFKVLKYFSHRLIERDVSSYSRPNFTVTSLGDYPERVH